MLFTRPLIIESVLSVPLTRARLRGCARTPYVADLAAFRRQQIIGWRLSEANESFLFQPEYGDTLDVEGARFVGLVEPLGTGSRIRGRISVSPLTKIVLSVWMLAVVVAAVAGLRQGTEAPARVLGIAALMFSAAVVMLRYSLWSTSRVVEARLRQSIETSGASVAA
jgi:hypothetical protein